MMNTIGSGTKEHQDQLSIDPSVFEIMCDEQALTGSLIMRTFQ
jgi:hypothetical protein